MRVTKKMKFITEKISNELNEEAIILGKQIGELIKKIKMGADKKRLSVTHTPNP